MRKKLFLILLCSILVQMTLVGFQSCCSRRNDDMCNVLSGMSLDVLDNADSTIHAYSGAVIAKAMVLQLHLSDSVIYCAYKRPKPFSLVPAAYAMCKTSENDAAIDSFIISSNRDFDAAHPAGSNLKDLFYIENEAGLLNGGDFNCYLRYAPADTGTHIFSVHLVAFYPYGNFSPNSRRAFDASSQPVKLLQ